MGEGAPNLLPASRNAAHHAGGRDVTMAGFAVSAKGSRRTLSRTVFAAPD